MGLSYRETLKTNGLVVVGIRGFVKVSFLDLATPFFVLHCLLVRWKESAESVTEDTNGKEDSTRE